MGNQRKNGYYLDLNMGKIDEHTGKSPVDLMGFAITQTPVQDHQLRLM